MGLRLRVARADLLLIPIRRMPAIHGALAEHSSALELPFIELFLTYWLLIGFLSAWRHEHSRNGVVSPQRKAINLVFAFQSLALRFAAHRMYLSMLEGHVHSI